MVETKVELPIYINNIDCVTECWTFFRMIILKNSPYYEDWISSHYHLFVLKGRFQFEQLSNTPEIYDTILHRKQIRYFDMNEEEIVNRFKKEINDGYYLNVTTKPHVDRDWYHEIVLYGYDDNMSAFYGIGLEGTDFKKNKYSYQFVENMLKEMKVYFRRDKYKRGMRLSEVFQYPICAFRLREDYCMEGCVFGAFHKLRVELDAKCYGEGIRDVNSWTYTGINCLLAWEDLIHEILNNNPSISKFLQVDLVIKLLHEHRKMMLVSMKYVQKKWEKAFGEEFENNILIYQECCNKVEIWKNLVIKYQITNDKTILKRIAAEIPLVYKKEHDCLDNMVNHCIDWDRFNEYYM